jgi:hypothetical protein
MRIKGKRILSNLWQQELVVTDIGIESSQQDSIGGKITAKSLPFEQIAQVIVVNGAFASSIKIINTGGNSSIFIEPVDKKEAKKFKELVEAKIQEKKLVPSVQVVSIADEIKKFSDLKNQGILTEEEFNSKKTELLAKI